MMQAPLEAPPVSPLLDLPLARLQVSRAEEPVTAPYPTRPDVEPTLLQNADGLWTLAIKQQGEYGKFEVPYIQSQLLLSDPESDLVVVLISYHGTEAYGPKRYRRVSKGQFYRYYWQQPGGWHRVLWQKLSDAWRTLILEITQEQAPAWARPPGKLSSERRPPAPACQMIAYKVVRVIEERYFSIYDPTQEYVIGERKRQRARPKHRGGFFTYATELAGLEYLDSCVSFMPYHPEVAIPALALLECEIGGRIIDYGHKWASTYLCPMRVLEVRSLP